MLQSFRRAEELSKAYAFFSVLLLRRNYVTVLFSLHFKYARTSVYMLS